MLRTIDKIDLACAVDALRRGQIIAHPTEAVWGLACDPFNKEAVSNLLFLKRRPVKKGLILVSGERNDFNHLLVGEALESLAALDKTWPGPVTWLVPHRRQLPRYLTGNHDTVALRVSAHAGIRSLCEQFGGPIVTTSANPTGCAPAMTLMQARRYFNTGVCYTRGVLGGQKRPSQIWDLRTRTCLRA